LPTSKTMQNRHFFAVGEWKLEDKNCENLTIGSCS
jgi:hypothetical protein